MALTDKEQSQLHYNAWRDLKEKLIFDFNRVLRHEAETLIETEGRILDIVINLNKIKEELELVNTHLTFFKERLQRLDKQEKGK